ncbi:MAG: hypothetical protein LBR07_09380, partial [Puniceicoccales bacterium]|nr:hypothetical protein [Puniceicoccales bacterium]
MTIAEQYIHEGEKRGEARGIALGEARGEKRGEARGVLLGRICDRYETAGRPLTHAQERRLCAYSTEQLSALLETVRSGKFPRIATPRRSAHSRRPL